MTKKPKHKPRTVVIALYVGSSRFLLSTPDRELGFATIRARDAEGVIVPPAVWLNDATFASTKLPDGLGYAAEQYLGYEPTELLILLPKGGAA
jgi:hypothetical protein